jgi:DNA-binding transcriptional LysR family regulator
MNLRQIETFRAAVEEGSFSGAAKRLQVSQPTISKVIDSLERTLDYPLFRREGRRVMPTVKAMALYREVVSAWRGLDRLSTVAQTLREPAAGRLVVGANPSLASGFIQKIIARFLETRPNVEVSLECDSGRHLVQGVLAGTIDIGFATRDLNPYSQSAPGTMPTERILVADMVCVLPADHRLADKAAIEIGDLDGEAIVGLATTREARRTVEGLFDKAGIVPRVAVEASTALAACMMVAEGLGVTICGDLSANAAARNGANNLAFRPLKPRQRYSVDCGVSRHAEASLLVESLRRLAQDCAMDVHRELMGQTADVAAPDKRLKRR